DLLGCDWPVRVLKERAIESLSPGYDGIDELEIMTDFLRGTPFQPREQCQNIFQIIETRALLRCIRLGRELLNFVISAILPPRERVEFGLSNNHLFVRPAHGDELADKWHLQLALRLHSF